MCGLVGIINREQTKLQSDKLIKVFTQALYCDALRGVHGTGILAVSPDAKAIYYKKALPSSDFIDLTKAKAIINGDNEFLCGHNRFATQGGHTSENAHPFYHGNVVMFHNGTLNSWKWMAKDKAFTVDSECLAYALSQAEDKGKFLETVDGAFSLVWYDSLEKTINFARNKERPMFFGMVKDSNSIIYASESGMISWLASRNGIELTDIMPTEVGKLITINIDPKVKAKLVTFKPLEEEDTWRKYYRGFTTIPKHKEAENKYSYLVAKKELLVSVERWEPYSNIVSNNRWGKLICKTDLEKDLIVNVSSISENDGPKYIGKFIFVKVTSAVSNNSLDVYSNLLSVADEEDLIIAELMKDNQLLSEEHKADTCCNCNDAILPSEQHSIRIDEDGSIFCRDCSVILNNALL